jgi:hypothetical protein
LVQAINFRPWTCAVEASVKVKVYVTFVALGTAEEIVSERNVSWPTASAFDRNSGFNHEAANTKTAIKLNNPAAGFRIYLPALDTMFPF